MPGKFDVVQNTYRLINEKREAPAKTRALALHFIAILVDLLAANGLEFDPPHVSFEDEEAICFDFWNGKKILMVCVSEDWMVADVAKFLEQNNVGNVELQFYEEFEDHEKLLECWKWFSS